MSYYGFAFICLTNYWFIFAVFYPYCAETDVNYSGAPVIESYNTTTTIEECVGKKFAFQKKIKHNLYLFFSFWFCIILSLSNYFYFIFLTEYCKANAECENWLHATSGDTCELRGAIPDGEASVGKKISFE